MTENRGSAFRICLTGAVTSFIGGAEGCFLNSPPIQSVSGYFYGTTNSSVYKITNRGEFTVLHTLAFAPIVDIGGRPE